MRKLRGLLDIELPTIVNAHFGVARSTLCLDEYNAIGGTHTINGGRGGVLEDRNALYIVRVEV